MVIDAATELSKPPVQHLRVLVFDPSDGTGHVALSVAKAGALTRFGLVALGDGHFVLASQPASGSTWKSCSFDITSTNTLLWTGFGGGPGKMIDDPLVTTTGVFLPVERSGKLEFAVLDSKSLAKGGCSEF